MAMTLAFLFPGQGRTADRPSVDTPLSETLFHLAESRGLALRQWMSDGDVERLTSTDASQPALLIDSLCRHESLRSQGLLPAYVAGHSLGEYAALVAADVLSAEDAVRLIIERGRLMGGVQGAMTAIVKLDIDTIAGLCQLHGPAVVIANHNAPGQVVVSGAADAVARVADAAANAGGRAIPLQVSGPFHSPLMLPAQEALLPFINETPFAAPSIPVVSGVSGEEIRTADRLRDLLQVQMTSSVRWVDVVHRLEEAGVTHAIEVGAGRVLSNLGKRITERICFMTYEEALDGGV